MRGSKIFVVVGEDMVFLPMTGVQGKSQDQLMDIIAAVMVGYDRHRGSINYLAVEPGHQRTGVGVRLVRQAQAFLIELGCPKVSFGVRKDNDAMLVFHDGHGYGMDDVYFLGKRLIQDE